LSCGDHLAIRCVSAVIEHRLIERARKLRGPVLHIAVESSMSAERATFDPMHKRSRRTTVVKGEMHEAQARCAREVMREQQVRGGREPREAATGLRDVSEVLRPQV